MLSSSAYRFLFCASCCLSALGANAQQAYVLPDSAAQYYAAAVGYNARLYNGVEYIRTYPNMIGHPFILSDSLQDGWIAYDGVLYNGIRLNFDIVRDEVIVKGAQTFSIRLIPEKIDSFGMAGRRFIRMAPRSATAAGIYELLYSGRVWALAKSTKHSSPAARPEDPLQFVARTTYYIKHGDAWYGISGKKDLLGAFKDRKDEVRKHLQQRGLNFRQNPSETLVAAAIYYDQITR